MMNRKWKRKETDLCREFCLVNSMIQTIQKIRTTIISAFEQNVSRLKQFRKRKRSSVDEVLL